MLSSQIKSELEEEKLVLEKSLHFSRHVLLDLPPADYEIIVFGKATLQVFGEGKPPLLMIPSLINKSYILNFYEESMAKHLSNDYTVYLLDWGEIEENDDEANFSVHDCISKVIRPAIAQISALHSSKVSLLGYCFGGNLALLTAAKHKDCISSITTIAMPFDFHKSGYHPFPVENFNGVIPKDAINAYFYIKNFESINRKYISGLSADAMRLEHWANDAINLSKKVYIDIRDNLLIENSFATEANFTSSGTEYNLHEIQDIKITNIVGQYDKVVPIASTALNFGEYKVLNTGHTGLVMASKFKDI